MQQEPDQVLQRLKPGFVVTGLKPYFNARVKLPNKRFPVTCKHVELSLCDPEIIKNVINNTIAQIEGVRSEYNEKKFMWTLEYGTKPIELTINKSDFQLRRIIEHKKYAALMAASKAIEYFPHNDEYDDELQDPIPFFANCKWCNIQIYLTYDEETNVILIEFNRFNGDHASFYFVSNIVESALKAPTLLTWIQRSDYLAFVEGIEYDRKTPTLKYLCDDMVKREISSYL
jgi:hypothetical protein